MAPQPPDGRLSQAVCTTPGVRILHKFVCHRSSSACCAMLQVPQQVLAACSELMALHDSAPPGCICMAAMPGYCMATILLVQTTGLPPAAASSNSANSSTSGSGVTAVLWQQVEQSGLLKHLPGLISSIQQGWQGDMTDQLRSTGNIMQIFTVPPLSAVARPREGASVLPHSACSRAAVCGACHAAGLGQLAVHQQGYGALAPTWAPAPV